MSRNAIILHNINPATSVGLELGPLSAPVIRRTDGEIYYADHASTDDLRAKYKDEPIVPEDIVDVDYVLGAGTVKEAVGDKKFDYIVAAHVIEHIPDTVRWLRDLGAVLKPGGMISLVVPNKLYTFDIARRVTRPAEIIEAYLERRTQFSTASMYDFAVNYVQNIDPPEVWRTAGPFDYSAKPRRYTPAEAFEMCQKNLNPATYVDCHCYVFTPAAFFDSLGALYRHDLLELAVDHFTDTNQDNLEFYVSLKKPEAPASQADLLASLPATPAEPSAAELAKRVAELEAHLHNITTSKAWRVTQPLRAATHHLKKLRRR